MTQAYRDALLEYLALGALQDELRGNQAIYELRTEVSNRKSLAREKIEKLIWKQPR